MIDYTLIVVSIISICGTIIITQLLQHNYYKKENFKYAQWKKKKVDTIDLKKIAKQNDVMLSRQELPSPAPPPENNIIDLLRGLDRDKIAGILSMVQGDDYEVAPDEKEGFDWKEIVGEVVHQNPKLVEQVLSGVVNKGGGADGETFPSQG